MVINQVKIKGNIEMLLNEGKFINTESLARHLYSNLMRMPELQVEYDDFSHVRPFRQWPELLEEFLEIIYIYKDKMAYHFDEIVKNIKGGFLVRYSPEHTSKEDKEFETIASINKGFQITIYKSFFRKTKRERIEILSHELIHLIQLLFPHEPEIKKNYYDQPYEIEALSKDIVYSIRQAIRRNKINTQAEAKKFLMKNEDFKNFPAKHQKRIWRKVLLDIYYYNPVNENINESKYFDTGNLPELLWNRVIDVLNKNDFPSSAKDGIKVYSKQAGKKEKMKSYKIEEPLFQDEKLWDEFKKSLSRYDLESMKNGESLHNDYQIVIEPNKNGGEAGVAFTSMLGITLSKEFFSFSKKQQLLILHHEATHIMQTQFSFHLGKYYKKLGTDKHDYNKDPFELQAYGSEITKEVNDLITNGKIKSMSDVSKLVMEHPFYKATDKKLKNKMFKKVMSNAKTLYNLPVKSDSFLESLNELKIPSVKLSDDELIDKILLRKQSRKENVEVQFILIFFNILKTYNIEPETFINRYHKYIDDSNEKSISIEEIIQFLRFVGIAKEHSKVAKVLRISPKRIEYLKTKLDVNLLQPIKRIMRHDVTDKTYAGKHFLDTKTKYNSMLIKSIIKSEKVQTLKENTLKLSALLT